MSTVTLSPSPVAAKRPLCSAVQSVQKTRGVTRQVCEGKLWSATYHVRYLIVDANMRSLAWLSAVAA